MYLPAPNFSGFRGKIKAILWNVLLSKYKQTNKKNYKNFVWLFLISKLVHNCMYLRKHIKEACKDANMACIYTQAKPWTKNWHARVPALSELPN